ncbi:ribbon-helix-helix protein, CopG family [Sulfolobus sp. E5-1-F]|uniref:ribbon-helix-helix domain-containing protein n=1 Tax=Sulfolobaceae TaxID=118883 RepID=UPI0012974DEE|nr:MULTISPECIES: ribbon-helix-helix domain-containing protein [unclassified Sulfolobus]QGA53831.1 ribbon-helix-helix protein, CopG family [Sulfolobus sp. E5-1-F]QGA68923.1 ribbon-helix-helix protein, CopG family [Sulfolobus sp. E11-6]
MSEVISVRLKKEIVKEIDELVSRGIFSSRNEALNFLILQGLNEANKWKNIIRKSKEVKLPIIEKGLEDFLSERDRY